MLQAPVTCHALYIQMVDLALLNYDVEGALSYLIDIFVEYLNENSIIQSVVSSWLIWAINDDDVRGPFFSVVKLWCSVRVLDLLVYL